MGVSVGVAGRASGDVGTSLAWLAALGVGVGVGDMVEIGEATPVGLTTGLAVASSGAATTGV